MGSLRHLFAPWWIGPVEISNRIVMAPMGTGYAGPGHTVSEQTIEYLAARARGGVGLIITEHTAVHPTGLTSSRMLGIFDDEHIGGFRRLAEAVHAHGARLAVQLQHGGRQADPAVAGGRCLSASAVPTGRDRRMPAEMTVEKIRQVVSAFGDAARRAKEAGCDGVEIHMAHGYLGASFLSPYLNRRADRYGGDTTRRCRFAREVIEDIREKCGEGLAVWARVSGDEFIAGGMTRDEIRRVAPLLQEAGYQAIHVSACMGETSQYASAPTYRPQGHLVHLAEAVKAEVDVPVIAVGNIWDPEYADEVIARGSADAVALGRSLLADPQWPAKAKEGRLEEIVPCLFCNLGCLKRHAPPEGQTQCTVNPLTGREAEWGAPAQHPARRARRIAVVGGGPAGLQFALDAHARGHEPVVYEREGEIGGLLRLACRPRGNEPLGRYLAWLCREVEAAGIAVRTETAVTAESVKELEADAIVIACGAEPAVPPPGLWARGDGFVSAYDVLAGRCEPEAPAVIIGGNHVGLQLALWLADRGLRPVVVANGDKPNALSAAAVYFLRLELDTVGVRVIWDGRVADVTDDSVVVQRDGHVERVMCGSCIVAGPVLPSGAADEIERAAGEAGIECHRIGDAHQPRDLHWALYQAAALARSV